MKEAMKKVLSEMLPAGASIPDNEEEIDYSFAIEYQGPPLTYNLPRAIPIDIKSIPVASVVSPNSESDKIPFPVGHPIIAPLKMKFSEQVALVSDSVVSPTSVIARELSGECSNSGCEEIDGVEPLGSSNDCELSERIQSSGTIDSNDHSQELSCEIEEDCGNETPTYTRKASVVTFRDEDSSYTVTDGSGSVESEYIHEREEPVIKLNKGLCYRCSKRTRFSGKEACIVCNAEYCVHCVLREMGSMPEGRKCISCIGYPIDDSKRRSLGKCSRMLKTLLSELEIKQIMKVEKSCETNQLRAELVYVNGRKLSQEELILLQSCPNPPTKLKPGPYWYDKVSGLWGKEGEKPCKIISPHLNVGGNIRREASNGNTEVLINNREITKAELKLLKLARVQYAGRPHFWLDENGFYQEEGQKQVKGNLWDKAGIKLFCAVLSLPCRSKVANLSAEEVNNLVSGAIPEYIKQRTLQKLLLVGYNGSGTSTIFKQAKMFYKDEPFSEHERQDIKFMIQRNVYSYLAILLEGRERFEEENLVEIRRKQLLDQPDYVGSADDGNDKSIYSISPKLKAFSDWLLKILVSGNFDAMFPAASRQYAPLVEELWKDAAIQATLDRRSELKILPRVASYFLERVVDISRTDYEPSNVDILYAEGITSCNGIACMDFSFPRSEQQGIVDAADQPDPLLRYQLVRVDARGLGEHCKWLEMFEDVKMVIFCVSLSDYDQICDDNSGASTNKMLASKKLFEDIITHPTFEQTDFLLILSKYDLLEEKIERVPLSECNWFTDFNLMLSNHPSNNNYIASPAEQAFHYIAAKFKKLFHSLTGRKLYVSLVNGLEPDTIKGALKYAREILKWDEDRCNYSLHDSSFNTETTSAP